jgi:hypothetical protein
VGVGGLVCFGERVLAEYVQNGVAVRGVVRWLYSTGCGGICEGELGGLVLFW